MVFSIYIPTCFLCVGRVCSKAVAMIFGFIQELMNFTKWERLMGRSGASQELKHMKYLGPITKPETKITMCPSLIFLFVYEKLGWICGWCSFSRWCPKIWSDSLNPLAKSTFSPLPLPLSYNLPEIAGLMIGAYKNHMLSQNTARGWPSNPTVRHWKHDGMVFEIRDDPSAFCWPSAYSQARKVSLVWDSLREWFFFGESLGCPMPWHFVKDWVCVSIQTWLRLYHKSGAWLWAMTKHEIRGSFAANSPAACQRSSFASLIREGGIPQSFLNTFDAWRRLIRLTKRRKKHGKKLRKSGCWTNRCSIWQRNFYKLMNLRQNRHDYSINLIGYRGSICCIPQCQT